MEDLARDPGAWLKASCIICLCVFVFIFPAQAQIPAGQTLSRRHYYNKQLGFKISYPANLILREGGEGFLVKDSGKNGVVLNFTDARCCPKGACKFKLSSENSLVIEIVRDLNPSGADFAGQFREKPFSHPDGEVISKGEGGDTTGLNFDVTIRRIGDWAGSSIAPGSKALSDDSFLWLTLLHRDGRSMANVMAPERFFAEECHLPGPANKVYSLETGFLARAEIILKSFEVAK